MGTMDGAPAPVRRVAFMADQARSLIQLRNALVRELMARGVSILFVAPSYTAEEASSLEAAGIERATFDATPKGLKLFADWKVMRERAGLLEAWRPDVVICTGAGTMVRAVLAARRARARRVVAIVTGLSSVVAEAGAGGRMPPAPRYAKAFKAASAVVFHNQDDKKDMERAGLLPAGLETHVVAGAGVNLDDFRVEPLPPISGGLVFLMVSRLDRTRGVIDYCEAARSAKQRAPGATFRLAGPAGDGPGGFEPEELRRYHGVIEFLGPLADVRPAIAQSHVFVYPSHREGMPRAVLEAMAMGRAIITTDAPGCRETVDDRVNGCLVPVADVDKLASAMLSFLKRPDLLPAMARASRLKAERRFDERTVNRTLLAAIGLND